MTDTTESAAPAQASLSDLRMPELQALASRMGITGISKMRKPQLVEAIRERRRANGQRPRTEEGRAAQARQVPDADSDGRAPAGKERAARQQAEREQPGGAPAEQPQPQERPDRAQGKRPATQGERGDKQQGERGDKQQGERGDKQQSRQQGQKPRNAKSGEPRGGKVERDASPSQGGNESDHKMASLDEIIRFPEPSERSAREEPSRGSRRSGRENDEPRESNDDSGNGDEERSGRRRRGRDRYRDRKRRQGSRENSPAEEEIEITEDDVLIPVAGVLDVLENYAFVRTSGYLPGASDVYVSLGQVKKAGLRRGDAITGAVRQPREGENQRQKFNALVRLDTVNAAPVEDASNRPDFDTLTPVHPEEQLRLETDTRAVTGRVLDLVAPVGKGQRGLVVAEPQAGTTTTLQQVATALTTNHPEIHLMVVLVDERPEEVTDWQRAVAGEVIASTFDRPASDHTTVAELALERAKRLVELGQDVVILLDSLTALVRAYNMTGPASGRVLAGGVDAAALFPPKRFFGAARNIENGGSLTILATELVETGSATDEVIAQELRGTASSQVRLLASIAEQRIFPAVDPVASSTSHVEKLLPADEIDVLRKLRRVLAELEPQAALETLLARVRQSGSNAELLLAVARAEPGALV